MRGYRALARATARAALTYRLSFVLGIGTVLVQLVALLAVWHAILAEAPVNGFTWPQMRAYLLVAFAAGTLVSILGDFRMAFRILDGNVALDLVKPVDYQKARLAESLGGLWIELLLIVVVVGGTLALTGGVDVPAGPALALFATSMLLLVPLKFLLVYVSTLACFWTQNYMGVQWARLAVINLLSGALIPLVYLPHWLATAAQWSPFAGLTSTPALIFLGRVGVRDGLVLVLVQLAWVLVLWFGARLIWRQAVRRLTVNGG
ncbi:ABC transporter permease [Paractinoplanes rhizophilus]|uniref:ABC transporter permease n=1 Tax=Paractinoplanes rhizophilus TaxID=1416877 RepID=A0ABW2HUU2_9ACTN|nr:ABC-2 family transporter protein [Actinoplanes sp.]